MLTWQACENTSITKMDTELGWLVFIQLHMEGMVLVSLEVKRGEDKETHQMWKQRCLLAKLYTKQAWFQVLESAQSTAQDPLLPKQ